MSLAHGGNSIALARERHWDWREVIDFSASINPLGPSRTVNEAITQNLDRIAHYPEREPTRLINALATLWHVDPEQILTGNGATELIYFLTRILKPEGVSLALPVFSEFHRAFPKAANVNLNDATTWPRDGLLVLTRPANPLGSTLPLPPLRSWLSRTENPVLIDESFLDFSQDKSAISLLQHRPNLMILRSLTKFYALPGLRIGALVSSASAVTGWKQHREPWQVNALAEEAALAAIADTEHAKNSLAYVTAERIWLLDQLKSLPGISPLNSDANFLYVRLNFPAQRLYDFLLDHKIVVRNCSGWPGLSGEAVRVAVRTRHENEQLIQHWRTLCG